MANFGFSLRIGKLPVINRLSDYCERLPLSRKFWRSTAKLKTKARGSRRTTGIFQARPVF
jgi:hypothetical protein